MPHSLQLASRSGHDNFQTGSKRTATTGNPLRSFASWVQRDIQAFLAVLRPAASIKKGLRAYKISRPDGHKTIHLRIEEEGSGVLFDNLSHVIHLNPTASLMAKMMLDGLSPQQSLARLMRVFRNVAKDQLLSELNKIYKMIERLRVPNNGCPVFDCSFVTQMPIFTKKINAPYKVDLALTYKCNNNCSHCYNDTARRRIASLDASDWHKILDTLASIGVPHIIFTGGEPTLYPQLLQLIKYADRLGQITGLNTNGRRLADAHFVDELAGAGLNHVQITLESCRPEVHNSITGQSAFHETVQGIENCLSTSLHTITNTTLTRQNVHHVHDIMDFLHHLGIRTFAMNGMIHSGKGRAHPDALSANELQSILIRVREKAMDLGMQFLWYTPTEYCQMSPLDLGIGCKRCNAGEYSMCIEPNGNVLPCQSFYVPAGNILTDEWKTIWNSELFLTFRNRTEDPAGSGLPEKCWHCPQLDVCGGGCRLEREAERERLVMNLCPLPMR
jgi:radical SAM protein with 4Fe4S-binding SPASM domain